MNTLRKQCAVVILTLILAVSAFAGQIQGPGAVSGTGTSSITGTGTTLLEDTTTTTTVIVTIISVIP